MPQQLSVSQPRCTFFRSANSSGADRRSKEDGRDDMKHTSGVVSDQAQGVWTAPATSWRRDEDLALHTGETLAVRTELDAGDLYNDDWTAG